MRICKYIDTQGTVLFTLLKCRLVLWSIWLWVQIAITFVFYLTSHSHWIDGWPQSLCPVFLRYKARLKGGRGGPVILADPTPPQHTHTSIPPNLANILWRYMTVFYRSVFSWLIYLSRSEVLFGQFSDRMPLFVGDLSCGQDLADSPCWPTAACSSTADLSDQRNSDTCRSKLHSVFPLLSCLLRIERDVRTGAGPRGTIFNLGLTSYWISVNSMHLGRV